MKLNDIKAPSTNQKLDEFFSSMFKKSNRTLSAQDSRAEKIFIQNFVSRAGQALDNAIDSGLVDPNAAGAPAATSSAAAPTPATPPTAAPAAPVAKPTVGANAAAANKAQQATSQNLNNYVQQAAKTLNAADPKQKLALTKELVNFMADRKGYPEWNNALATVQQIIKKNIQDPNFANAAINRIKAGQTMAEAWQVYYINKLIEAVGFSWDDLGLVLLKESKTAKNYIIAESKFAKMNMIFESILTDAAGAQSISAFLSRWLTQYMKGTNLSGPETASRIKQLIDAVQSSWKDDEGEEALTQLAQAAYAAAAAPEETGSNTTATASPATPSAAAGSASPSATPATPTTPAAKKDPVSILYSAFSRLDMTQKQKLLAMISGAK